MRSIGAKIQMLAGAAFLSGLAAVLSYQTVTRVNASVAERREANFRIVQSLAGPASGAIALQEDSVIYSYMELLSSDAKAAGIVITANKQVLNSQQSVDYFDLPSEKLSKAALEAEKTGETQICDVGEYQFIAVPVKDGSERVIGSIAVAWSIKGMLNSVWAGVLREAGAMIAVVGMVLLVLLMSLQRFVTDPLKQIAAQIDKPPMPGAVAPSATARFDGRQDEIGTFARALGKFYRDASEKHVLHERLDSALSNMSQGLCMFDRERKLVLANARYARMHGLEPEMLKVGTSMDEVIRAAAQSHVFGGPDSADEQIALATSGIPAVTTREMKNGRTITTSYQPMADGGVVITHADVTELKRIEKKLNHLASHDPLTNLPNRRRFLEHLDEVISRTQSDEKHAVLFVDLDKFKAINDSLGHAAGDELLKTVAARLMGCVRPDDMVSRLGGDEFAVLQVSSQQPGAAEALAKNIARSLALPVNLGASQMAIETSIGIAIAPTDGRDSSKLLGNADMALLQAKTTGRNKYCFFEPEMGKRLAERRQMETELTLAMANEDFELHFQPLVSLASNEITGFEALIRWRHAERGLISPAEFIPVAEETGLIVPIGEWVLRKACEQATQWPAHTGISVNISAVQFHRGDLAQTVFGALAHSQLAPHRLEIEITESALLHDDKATIDVLHRLRSYGVRIAMDDFGTGYSALSYLNKFPFDKIKIDRGFIQDLGRDNRNNGVIHAVASISRSFNIPTVAEGVETENQKAFLKHAGITEIQGYLFSPPRRGEDINKLFYSDRVAGTASKSA